MEKLKLLREPSTWAGISVLLTLIGLNPVTVQAIGAVVNVLPDALQLVSAVGGGASGIAAIFLRERGGQ